MAIIYGHVHREKQSKTPPKPVQNIDDIDKVHQDLRKNIKLKLAAKLFPDIKKPEIIVEKKKDTSTHVELSEEIKTIDILSQLDDEYHILYGVNIELANDITYHGKKNLKYARMDFVVISKRGIILIKIKKEKSDSHEQVDMDAKVLWSFLKSWRNPKSPGVESVLLSVKDNIQNDSKYKSVTVSNLDKINSFLQNSPEKFSEQEVKRIVNRLKGYVTK